MSDKYPSLTPYAYCANNPVILMDPDGRDWVLITGDKVYWYGGKTGDKSNLMHTYNSASGMSNAHLENGEIINLQQAKYQNVRNGGPTPEGKYEINLIPDPSRVANTDPNTGELLRNPEGGIEKVPDRVEAGGGKFFTYEAWGENRAYLKPIRVTGATSEQRDNDSYYIHDSEKGYTHGCIEVDSDFFNQLNNYRNAGNKKIEVIVKYPDQNHKTNGSLNE